MFAFIIVPLLLHVRVLSFFSFLSFLVLTKQTPGFILKGHNGEERESYKPPRRCFLWIPSFFSMFLVFFFFSFSFFVLSCVSVSSSLKLLWSFLSTLSITLYVEDTNEERTLLDIITVHTCVNVNLVRVGRLDPAGLLDNFRVSQATTDTTTRGSSRTFRFSSQSNPRPCVSSFVSPVKPLCRDSPRPSSQLKHVYTAQSHLIYTMSPYGETHPQPPQQDNRDLLHPLILNADNLVIFHLSLSKPGIVPDDLLTHLHAEFSDELERGDTYPQEGPMDLDAFKAYFFAKDVFVAIRSRGTVGDGVTVEEVKGAERTWKDVVCGFYYVSIGLEGFV